MEQTWTFFPIFQGTQFGNRAGGRSEKFGGGRRGGLRGTNSTAKRILLQGVSSLNVFFETAARISNYDIFDD